MAAWVAAVCAALAASLVVPLTSALPAVAAPSDPVVAGRVSVGWMLRYRALWSVAAGFGGALFVGGRAGPVLGMAAAVTAWVVIGRAESPQSRRTREEVRRDLPHVVDLLASTLRSGAAPAEGVAVVCAALPGAATSRLSGVCARLSLGVDPAQVWQSLADDPELAPLGRTLARAHATGASVVPSVERLADDLARRARGEVEDRARAVGVKAALPLGLCLLPAFLLVGIVPLVVGLLETLAL